MPGAAALPGAAAPVLGGCHRLTAQSHAVVPLVPVLMHKSAACGGFLRPLRRRQVVPRRHALSDERPGSGQEPGGPAPVPQDVATASTAAQQPSGSPPVQGGTRPAPAAPRSPAAAAGEGDWGAPVAPHIADWVEEPAGTKIREPDASGEHANCGVSLPCAHPVRRVCGPVCSSESPAEQYCTLPS